jgi:hypothetical protein
MRGVNQVGIADVFPFVPPQAREARKNVSLRRELTKSAHVATFIVEGDDLPISQLFAVAKRADQEVCDFVSQRYSHVKMFYKIAKN